jgi:hypothetical protein
MGTVVGWKTAQAESARPEAAANIILYNPGIVTTSSLFSLQVPVLAAGTIVSETDIESRQPLVEHAAGTSDTRIDPYGLDRAVEGTGPALHALVPVNDGCLRALHLEYQVRTDRRADPATDTGLPVQLKGSHAGKIVEAPHGRAILMTSRTTAAAAAVAITGRDRFISRRTPDGEVKGVLPVKFIA